MADVRAALEEHGTVGVIYVTVPRAEDLEALYGYRLYDKFIADLARTLEKFRAEFLKPNDLLVVREVNSSEFIIFVRPSAEGRAEEVAPDALESYKYELAKYLAEKREVDILRGHRYMTFHLGTARIISNLFSRPERIIFAAIDEARRSTLEEAETEARRQREVLKRIIVREEIDILFQPIVSLSDLAVFGFEALSTTRGGSGIEGAEMLFALADEAHLATQLDRVCRRRALAEARRWLAGARLFINTNPRTIEEIGTRDDPLAYLFQGSGVNPRGVVLEITERSAIGNIAAFEATLDQFRSAGVGVAVDDAGAGYASLNTIARLKPEFLKFDMALVRDIDKDRVKQELLATVQDLARRVNARVIAEGIETPAEFETLRSFGVDYGQGYLIGKPMRSQDLEASFPAHPERVLNFTALARVTSAGGGGEVIG